MPANEAPTGDRLLCSGLRVVTVGESISAAVAGMVLADFGAEVTVLEPPLGSRLRAAAAWRMWSRGARTVSVDLTTPDGSAAFDELSGGADVLLVALQPATADRLGLDGATMCARHPRLVHCEITGFGRGHPLSDVPGHEGIVTAAAGRAHELGVLFEGERPAFPAVPVATHGAAMLALEGVFAALFERERTGRGQAVATSLLSALTVFDIGGWTPGATRALRLGDNPMIMYPVARTRDGVWVQFAQNGPALFRALLRALELDAVLEDERFRTAPNLRDPDDLRALRAVILERVAQRTWDEWRAVFDTEPDVSAEPFVRPGDALTHPQLVHTGDSAEVSDPVLGTTRQLGPLFTVAAAHTAGHRAATGARPLLQGVTVLELSTWIATPMSTALLAELGARVIKIETLDGDPMRRHGPMGLKFVQGKDSLALDLKSDAGRAVVHRLAASADVLVHNFRPGVPERLGIDDATLRAINPSLVHVYAASYGSTGPMAARPAFHVTAGAVCGGVLAQVGRDGPPGPDADLSAEDVAAWSLRLQRANESHPDFDAALVVAVAITMALFARERSGRGYTMETRMMAANAYAFSEHFVDYPARPPRLLPDAGLHGLHALNRLYRARDDWIHLVVGDDEELVRLCDVLGDGELAKDARFATAVARARHDDELADELAARLVLRDAQEWESDLGRAGVACVRAYDGTHAKYVFDAPWSESLGFVEQSAAAGTGPYARYGRVVRTGHDLGPLGAADAVGAQTRAILAGLGYSDDEVENLHAAGVVGIAD
jgi:crotonobetainyl-CoA:carnitine CoA-transferase CaiB-like acyl-CoA transferase